MKSDLEICSTGWIGEASGDAESAAMTGLVIRIGDRILTRLEDIMAKTNRDGPWVSAYRLAVWLVANWWRLRHEHEPPKPSMDWRMSHQLGAVGGGYVWPDITMACDGELLEFHCRQTTGGSGEKIRYLVEGRFPVAVADFERAVDDFIDTVLTRLHTSRQGGNDLRRLRDAICTERKDDALAARRSLEALLGFDRCEATDDFLSAIEEKGKDFGIEATKEVSASDPGRALEILNEIRDNTAALARPITIPGAENLRVTISRECGSAPMPWQRGEIAARIVAREWNLGSGPVTDKMLSSLFAIESDFIVYGNDEGAPLAIGYRDGDPISIKVVLKKRRHEQRRFMLARLVGDHLNAGPADRLLPATDLRTARQKFQRAFAHELLCPLEQLKAVIGSRPLDQDTIEEAAAYFMVSPLLVAHKLADKGICGRESLLESW